MFKIKVPGTCANMGPGFDTLGLALNLYNTYSIEEIESGLEITGCERRFANEKNLVYTSMLRCFEKIGYVHKGIRIHMDTEIPISRGLGSSAACILGGVLGANLIAGNLLNRKEILEIATEIEGHPDNIAPALLGGLVVSIMEGHRVIYNKVAIHEGIKFIALIPDFSLSTKEARSVLPKRVDFNTAIFNVSRVSLLLSSLVNGEFQLLQYGLKDSLHQDYRGKLIPDYFDIVKACEYTGSLGTFLSGAGPTIMNIVRNDDMKFKERIEKILNLLNQKWKIQELHLDLNGIEASSEQGELLFCNRNLYFSL